MTVLLLLDDAVLANKPLIDTALTASVAAPAFLIKALRFFESFCFLVICKAFIF